jgi:cytochrome P450
MIYATLSPEPFSWRKMQTGLPIFMQNPVKAMKRYEAQREYDRTGKEVVVFDETHPYTTSFLIMESMGFPRAEIQREKEKRFLANDRVRYFANRETYLRNEYFKLMQADETPHPPSKKDWDRFEKRVDTYNRSVDSLDPRLTITDKDLMDSWKLRKKAELNTDLFGTTQKKYSEVAEQVLEALQ